MMMTSRLAACCLAGTILAAPLAGCTQRPQEFMREPVLTPVGAGLKTDIVPHHFAGDLPPRPAFNSLYQEGSSLYRDPRAMRPGDVLTIAISINDKATLGNNTDRSIDSEVTNKFDAGFGPTSITGSFDSASKSSANGQGTIDRSEKVQVSVGAVVTEVLPDGNLVVSGSQEVRVNFEIRQVYVAGIVRPRDISKDNTIPYERIAEARISYGGRGRLSEVQQPNWGQQLYDNFRPF